jgi:hypothetical protein
MHSYHVKTSNEGRVPVRKKFEFCIFEMTTTHGDATFDLSSNVQSGYTDDSYCPKCNKGKLRPTYLNADLDFIWLCSKVRLLNIIHVNLFIRIINDKFPLFSSFELLVDSEINYLNFIY